MENLVGIAKEVIEANNGLILSGGLALALQNVKTRNTPSDIDFCFTCDMSVNKVSGMVRVHDFNEDDYNEHFWRRERYQFKGVDLDIFIPNSSSVPLKTTIAGNITVLHKFEIINFKVQHALDSSVSRRKHKDDVIHILINN